MATAQAPERFTQKFLEGLEFSSSNDRLYLGLLKSLKFIDESGVPLDRYYKFLDQSQSKRVLAEAIREAYGDLFALNTKAFELTTQDVKNKFRTLTQGKKTDNVLYLMANTFRALCEYADWSPESKSKVEESKHPSKTPETLSPPSKVEPFTKNGEKGGLAQLHYNIQIHLPESRDQAVYDALFKSLKDHLL
ncbi:MAG TPA: DUF5343 domain-containing protein [Candidatus Dormibacteraeota bacterium]|nr:DUF5343 domain-containing protein [Candidatus Dormibacteraeota bacterium]